MTQLVDIGNDYVRGGTNSKKSYAITEIIFLTEMDSYNENSRKH